MAWKWVATIVGLYVLYLLVDGVSSAWTLSDYVKRPVTALEREGRRVAVMAPPGSPDEAPRETPEGMARAVGGVGVPLGYTHDFVMPGGGRVRCTHMLNWMWCAEGWRPIRGAPRSPDNGGEVGGDVTRHVE